VLFKLAYIAELTATRFWPKHRWT